MTEPYVKATPGDPILSEHWNTIQIRGIEALRTHTHQGGDDGKKLGGSSIDPDTTLTVKQVDATATLTVKGLNVFDRLTGLVNEKLAVTGGTVAGTLTVNGNVGIGAASPKAKLDIQEVARSGVHPATVRGLYVTGEFGGEADGVEFRHSNGTQGVGIGHNTLYATGSNADQDLGLKARGNGKVTIRGDLKIGGPSLLSATGRRILETNAGDDWLRVNGNTDYKSIALYSTVAIGEGGLSIGEWAQLPKGNLKATGTIHAEQDLLLGRNANNMRFIAHSRNGANGDFLHLTSDKADGSWDWTNGIVLKRGGGVGLGTQSPNKKLTVDYAGSTTDHATAEFRQTGSNSWGMALVVRTVGGQDGAGVLFRSRTKNWQIRGESGVSATGFQITEDGGDAEYGSGFGTPRLHISAGGAVGIGTTLPQGQLHVGSAGNVLTRIEAGGTGGWAELDLYSTYNVANLRKWNLAAKGDGGFAIRQLTDARGLQGTPLSIDTAGTVSVQSLRVQGDLYAANSAMYFTKTDHDHSGIGNTTGYAAIENSRGHDALMLMGRQTAAGRVVKVWDYLEVNGSLKTTGDLTVGGRYVPHYASGWVDKGAGDTSVMDFNVGFFPVMVSVMAKMTDGTTYVHIRPGAQSWDDIFNRDETVFMIVANTIVRIFPSSNSANLGGRIYDGPAAIRAFRVVAWRGD